jgi:hypothetical protein
VLLPGYEKPLLPVISISNISGIIVIFIGPGISFGSLAKPGIFLGWYTYNR